MPFDIACAFFETGDMALLDLWHEFERETIGRSVIRFTKGLRARLLHETEQTDEALAALHTGGFAALVELLTVYHLDEPGGYWQLEGSVEAQRIRSIAAHSPTAAWQLLRPDEQRLY